MSRESHFTIQDLTPQAIPGDRIRRMRKAPALAVVIAAGAAVLPLRPTKAEGPAAAAAGTRVASELPPIPPQSPRTSNYSIEARLDEAKHQIEGKLVLEWTNTSGEALSRFPFHLYWNAFRNNL